MKGTRGMKAQKRIYHEFSFVPEDKQPMVPLKKP
jgi:hypothetical protein